MTFYGGTELASVYEEALDEGFGLVASNVAEPNVMIGLLQGAAQADSDLLLQMSNGACTFAVAGERTGPVADLQQEVRADARGTLHQSHQYVRLRDVDRKSVV